jgi:hypothetical protein
MMRAGGAVVAVLEELGHGVDADLEELGQQPEGDDDQRDGGHPLVAGDGEADGGERAAGHADEVLGGDVGGDQREADEPPGQLAAREEVVFLVLLLARDVERDADDGGEEGDEGDDVEG